MKKLLEIISKYSYLFMLVGFVSIAIGLMLVLRINHGSDGNIEVAWVLSGFGLFFYIVGRIGLVIGRKNRINNR